MNSKPKVSIITLTYKDFKGLFSTIESVLNQDYPNFEYFISDDGSDNFPREEVLQFVMENKKSNVSSFHLIVNPVNVGTVKHINNVLKMCSGEYIFDIPCKDRFFSNTTVSNVVDLFIEKRCDALFTSRIAYADGKIKEIVPHVYDWKNVNKLDTREKRYSAFMMTQHYGMFIGANFTYKRSAIEAKGYFDEKYFLLEDAPMIADFLWENDVELCPELITMIYECKTGVSNRKKSELLAKDLNRYNCIEKKKHYTELNKKTQKHIDFGIERGKPQSSFRFVLLCFKYSLRILDYLTYLSSRKIRRIGDYSYIRSQSLNKFV